MNIEANCPYWVWFDGYYYEGMLLGERDADACSTDVALLEWLGNIWARWGRVEPWWEASGDGGQTEVLLQIPRIARENGRVSVPEGHWLLRTPRADEYNLRAVSAREFSQEGYVVGLVADGLPAVDLMAWCSVDEHRRNLSRPWTVGGWTYATDGRSAIRVPATGIDYDNGWDFGPRPNMELAVDFEFVWPSSSPTTSIALWVRLPQVERVAEMLQCPDCDGSGKGPEVFCECCEVSHRCGDCDACEGEKSRLQPLPVVTGSGLIAWELYERLRALPGVEIGILAGWEELADSRISFRFEGGSGLVLGMTWTGSGPREREAILRIKSLRADLFKALREEGAA